MGQVAPSRERATAVGIGPAAAAAISFARAVPQIRRWRSEQAVTSPAESGVTRMPEGVTGGGR